MKLKSIAILFFPVLLGFAGILLLSAFYRVTGFQEIKTEKKKFTTSQTFSISDAAAGIEFKIRNSVIDIKSVEEEINKLKSDFEKNYLNALLKIRAGDYLSAYNFLVPQLEEDNFYPPFYDELVNAAKITNNFSYLTDLLQNKKAQTTESVYLSALIKFENGSYKESIKEFENILNEDSSYPHVIYKLAYANRLTGNYDESINQLDKAAMLISDDDPFRAKILNAKGSIYFLSGDYESAENFYRDAFKTAQQTGSKVEEIKATGNLALIKDSYGDVYSAREDLMAAISEAEKIENPELLAFLYSELGVSFTYTNEIIEARKNYEQSYSYYSVLKNRERLSYLSANIGSVFLQESNYKSALKYYKEGLNHSAENKLGQILNLTGIADVYSNSSNYSEAIKYYNKANELADSIESVTSLIKTEQGLGALFFNINKPLRALNFLKQAESRINKNDYPYETTQLFYKLGTVLSSIDSLNSAVNYFKNGLEIASQTGDLYNEVILNTELAHTLYLQNSFDEAVKYLNKASVTANEFDLTQLQGLQQLYFGKINLAQNKYTNAYNYFSNSYSIAEKASDKNTQIEAGYNLAKLLLLDKNSSEAENWFKKTVSIIENISLPLFQNQEIQIAHFTGFDEIYNSFIDFYLTENRNSKAFEILEKSRSRNTMQNIINLKLTSSVRDEELLNNFIDLNWMYNSDLYSAEEKTSIKNEIKKLKEKIKEKDPQLAEHITLSPFKSIEEIKSKLKEDDNLISIYLSENKTVLFHLTKNALQTYSLKLNRAELKKLLKAIAPIYKSDIAKDEIYVNQDLFSFNAKAAYNFYQAVLKDVIETIPGNETLIFSFADELLLLPAELLVTEWKEGDSPFYYADKKFLVEKYPVIYTPSASIYIAQLQKESSSNKNNLLIGDPEINNDEFTISYRSGLLSDDNYSSRNIELFPLEYSDEEIENVNNIISDNIILVSDDATEENFKMNASESNLIHLSTHSFLYKNQPLIILSHSNDEENDGYLEISEIVQLNLNSDLVVLSSCRSGLGKIDEAEGIIGMQKAFFEAGANSIVVSLWDVNDKYTSYFMKDFYNYLGEGFTKPEALRNAKTDFIKKYSPNPYYWSAFVLSGNPSGMNLKRASSINVVHIFLILLVVSMVYFSYRKMKRT